MHDLVIRGGTIVDGTGAARFVADVAVDGGQRLVQAGLGDVVQKHVIACQGEDMGDPVAHLPGADHAYRPDLCHDRCPFEHLLNRRPL
mgnify:CR=1 FL=1